MRIEIVINRDPVQSPLNHFDRVIAFDAKGHFECDEDIQQAITGAMSLSMAPVVTDEGLL